MPDQPLPARAPARRRNLLAIAAGALFLVSFLLPADGELKGISCLGFCWGVLTEIGSSGGPSLGGWAYYSGFVAANALFLALLAALLLRARLPGTRLCLSLLAFLHVLSWLVVNLVAAHGGDRFDLRSGYFIWLLAFGMLAAAHVGAGGPHRASPGAASAAVLPDRQPRAP